MTLSPWAIVLVDTWMWTPYVMLICLAGLRSIPDYIYEAAEVDRASKWRQFWTITLPMAPPFIMLAVLFRGIENFKMFDMVNLLTGGGPGSTTEVASITLKREAFEKWRTGYSSAFAIILFVTVFGLANIYVKALNRVKNRSDERHRHRPFGRRAVAADASASRARSSSLYAIITMVPLAWIVLTSFKSPPDSISYPPKVLFEPTLEGYCNLFTTRSRQTPNTSRACRRRPGTCEQIARARNMVVVSERRTSCRASGTPSSSPSARPRSRCSSARSRPTASRASACR